ncbi:pyridoxine 5'-phosphate oxidase C-terminal domain-containing protein [Streptomyces sp. NPDC005547]|uniref:pyridoxine 5'-phosphate oxidase C-terminal domain-containing protein n=1 Tax=Streptomyces sp. NPDC005547 TaxID=3154887 RepID=UPI0033B42983
MCTPVPAATVFWQSDTDRLHRRRRYERVGRHAPWERHPLRLRHAVGRPGRAVSGPPHTPAVPAVNSP